MKQMPLMERDEVFVTVSSLGEPLFWKVDEYGHVRPLAEGETVEP